MGKVLTIGLVTVGVVGTAATALRLSGIWERIVSWGIDPILSASALPGDDLVVDPIAVDTRTLEIAAPPSAIWPWLVQMGDDRGGEYSYSAFGLPHRKGADRIVPEWQDLAVGDPINEWVVHGLEPERTWSSTATSPAAGAGPSSSSRWRAAGGPVSSSASGLVRPSRVARVRPPCG